MDDKQKYLNQINERLGKWQDHLDDLRNMARDQDRNRQRKAEKHIDRVQHRLDDLRRQRDEAVNATEKAWKDAKAEAEQQYEQVARTVDELTDRLSRETGIGE